jgi:DNA-binding SARP family transcriptional activator
MADPVRVYKAMGDALPARARLPRWQPGSGEEIAHFADRYFRALWLVNGSPALWILDDLPDLATQPALTDVLRKLVESVPPEGAVLLLARQGPPDGWQDLLATCCLSSIDGNDMRLEPKETAALVKSLTRDPALDCGGIHQKSGGWAAMVVLLANASRESMDQDFDALAEKAFASETAATRTLLLRLPWLPEFDVPTAVRVSLDPAAQRHLDRVYRQGLFVFRSGSRQEHRYRFHSLWRQWLARKARENPAVADWPASARRTAAELEASGLVGEAVELWLDAGQAGRAVDAALAAAASAVASGRAGSLRGWVAAIAALAPQLALEEPPLAARLAYWEGIAWRPESLAKSHALLAEAFDRCPESDVPGRAALASAAAESLALQLADLHGLDSWIDRFSALPDTAVAFAGDPAFEARVVAGMLTALVCRRPEHPLAGQLSRRAAALLGRDLPPSSLAALSTVVYLHYWLGDHRAMREALDRFSALLRGEAFDAMALVWWHHAQTLCFSILGDAGRARAAVENGQRVAQEHALDFMQPLLLMSGHLASAATGRVEDVEDALACVADRLDPARTLESATWHHLSGWSRLLRGDAIGALGPLRRAYDTALRSGMPGFIVLRSVHLAIAHALAGDTAAARFCLATAESQPLFAASPWLRYEAAWAHALVSRAESDRRALERSLRDALRLSFQHGYVLTRLWLPKEYAILCAEALGLGLDPLHLQHVIRAAELPAPGATASRWPWAMKIRVLGDVQIEIDGLPVTFDGKAQRRPLELLLALAAAGGRRRNARQLADELWPDCDGDPLNAFQVALHRLRRLLRDERLVRLAGGEAWLDSNRCWIDLAELEEWLGMIQDADGQSPWERMRLLYRGKLAEERLELDWLAAHRERLHRRIMNALKATGERLDAGPAKAALAHWRLASEFDVGDIEIRHRLDAARLRADCM